MKRFTAIVALSLAAGAFAQSGIPTGITANCTTFLTALNTNPTINNCLTALIDQTNDFDPSTTGASTSSSSAVQTALANICAPTFDKCPQADIRTILINFYNSCGTDMMGPNGDGKGNQDVIAIYDVLYLITPLKGAICSKDGDKYCVNVIASDNSPSNNSSGSSSAAANTGSSDAPAPSGSQSSNAPSSSAPAASSASSASASSSASGSASASHSSSASSAAASPSQSTHARRSYVHPSILYRRADNTTDQQSLGTVAPQASEYNSLGLPYLFITANFTQQQLCTTCTAEVVGQYISFETVTPYALGIANSPMLSGQVALWNKIKDCPNNYAASLLNNVTGSTTSIGGAASVKFGAAQVAGAVVAALVGGMMLF